MSDLSSPDAEDMKREMLLRVNGTEEGRARRRWRMVERARRRVRDG
jgi:hypothetical protein